MSQKLQAHRYYWLNQKEIYHQPSSRQEILKGDCSSIQEISFQDQLGHQEIPHRHCHNHYKIWGHHSTYKWNRYSPHKIWDRHSLYEVWYHHSLYNHHSLYKVWDRQSHYKIWDRHSHFKIWDHRRHKALYRDFPRILFKDSHSNQVILVRCYPISQEMPYRLEMIINFLPNQNLCSCLWNVALQKYGCAANQAAVYWRCESNLECFWAKQKKLDPRIIAYIKQKVFHFPQQLKRIPKKNGQSALLPSMKAHDTWKTNH